MNKERTAKCLRQVEHPLSFVAQIFTINGERDNKSTAQLEHSVYVRSKIMGSFEVILYMSESTLF